MEQQISIRLGGYETDIGAVVRALRGSSDVDDVVELGVAAPREREDYGFGDLLGGLPTGFQDVEVRVADSLAYDHVHGRIENLAAHAGVVVEWLSED